ncbi:cytochrome b [Vibrio sp. ZSDE26]|uniref:Cytochrome b n=1 Tax=Vibrio amylolyticus TaxID=2847292 RepID=A0A9X1XR59_9VIBR|nr:cytochrome b [Vibrio amylolyticus]MCK6264054.1 cytochrome b [Vibrio amylolyticus]
MKVTGPVDHFSTASKVMHHVSAFAFIVALLIMLLSPDANSWGFELHQSFGMVVLGLYVVRIAWLNWTGHPPALGNHMDKFVARMAHFAMYAIIVLMPLSGLFITMAKAKSTSVFGLFTIPGFAERNSGLIEFSFQIHSILEIACYVLIAAHILGTLSHHVIKKDGTFIRMMGMNKND